MFLPREPNNIILHSKSTNVSSSNTWDVWSLVLSRPEGTWEVIVHLDQCVWSLEATHGTWNMTVTWHVNWNAFVR